MLQNRLHIAIIGKRSIFLLKSPKTSFFVVRAHFSAFRKNKEKTTPGLFDEKSTATVKMPV